MRARRQCECPGEQVALNFIPKLCDFSDVRFGVGSRHTPFVIPGLTRDPAFLLDRAGFDLKRDPPEFTNEVQHLKQVVPCRDTVNYRSRNADRLPVFMKTGTRAGKTLHLFTASPRRSNNLEHSRG